MVILIYMRLVFLSAAFNISGLKKQLLHLL